MTKIKILSKILGSQYFEQLMIDEKAINRTLNARDLNFIFEPNIKYFEIKKNVEDMVLSTMKHIQDPISSKDRLRKITHSLFYADENQDNQIDYLYKYHFNAIYATLFQQLTIAEDFVAREAECQAALDLFDEKIKQYDCRENWLAKYLDLFEKVIQEENDQRFDHNRDAKLYSITKLKILLTEDMLIQRQKFKCKYVQLAKELNKQYRNYYVDGVRYFDDY